MSDIIKGLTEGQGGLSSATAGVSQPARLPVGFNRMEPIRASGDPSSDTEAQQFRKNGGVVAAFYYGEWETPGTSYNTNPWAALQPYSDRLPLASQKIASGVYGLPSSSAAAVAWEQRAAKEAGIDVFIHNTYWMADPALTPPRNITQASLQAHADCPVGLKFALQWTNDTTTLTNLTEFNAVLDYLFSWPQNYGSKYWKVGGKPVLYIYDVQKLMDHAKVIFSESDGLVALRAALTHMRQRAVTASLGGLYLVSCSGFDHPFWTGRAFGWVGCNESVGFDAQTVYNRFYANGGRVQNSWGGSTEWNERYPLQLTHYAQLTELYGMCDNWMLYESGAQITIQAPAICGWDRRPWLERDSSQPSTEDYCIATPEEWLTQLRQQRRTALQGTQGRPNVPPVVTMYAWNEYGEGGFLCPSRRYGWALLEQIRQAFGTV